MVADTSKHKNVSVCVSVLCVWVCVPRAGSSLWQHISQWWLSIKPKSHYTYVFCGFQDSSWFIISLCWLVINHNLRYCKRLTEIICLLSNNDIMSWFSDTIHPSCGGRNWIMHVWMLKMIRISFLFHLPLETPALYRICPWFPYIWYACL